MQISTTENLSFEERIALQASSLKKVDTNAKPTLNRKAQSIDGLLLNEMENGNINESEYEIVKQNPENKVNMLLKMKENNLSQSSISALPLEEQLKLTSAMLKPIQKTAVKVSEKVLEKERVQKEAQQNNKANNLNYLAMQIKLAINKENKNKITRMRDLDSDQDSSETETDSEELSD